jgi:3-hydroxyacyl-CoA dehydrogenase
MLIYQLSLASKLELGDNKRNKEIRRPNRSYYLHFKPPPPKLKCFSINPHPKHKKESANKVVFRTKLSK